MNEICQDEAIAHIPILNPKICAFAAYRSDVHDLDADRLLQTYTSVVRRAGATILTKSPVTKITKTGGMWHVTAGEQIHITPLLIWWLI